MLNTQIQVESSWFYFFFIFCVSDFIFSIFQNWNSGITGPVRATRSYKQNFNQNSVPDYESRDSSHKSIHYLKISNSLRISGNIVQPFYIFNKGNTRAKYSNRLNNFSNLFWWTKQRQICPTSSLFATLPILNSKIPNIPVPKSYLAYNGTRR